MRSLGAWVGVLALWTLVGCTSDAVAPPEQRGVQLDLPTSDWEPGDEVMFALISGVVRVDAQDCVFLRAEVSKGVPPIRLWPVWPKGFAAYRHEGGVALFGPEGEVIAHEGDIIESAGGHVPIDESVTPSECLPTTGDIAAIQGPIRVVSD